MEQLGPPVPHELIKGCGNQTLILVAGTLESLWARQSEAWTYRVTHAEDARRSDLRRRGLEEHRAIADAIASGEAELAEKLLPRARAGSRDLQRQEAGLAGACD